MPISDSLHKVDGANGKAHDLSDTVTCIGDWISSRDRHPDPMWVDVTLRCLSIAPGMFNHLRSERSSKAWELCSNQG